MGAELVQDFVDGFSVCVEGQAGEVELGGRGLRRRRRGLRGRAAWRRGRVYEHLRNGLAALRDRDRVEELAPLVRESSYLEPFVLRALGVVREDDALVRRAVARFEVLGLRWHAAETKRLVAQA
jgi:hypothetical protein